MKSGYYWVLLFGEEMIVRVMDDSGYEQVVNTFEYGYQNIEDVEFISKEPITINNARPMAGPQ